MPGPLLLSQLYGITGIILLVDNTCRCEYFAQGYSVAASGGGVEPSISGSEVRHFSVPGSKVAERKGVKITPEYTVLLVVLCKGESAA